MAYNSLRKEVLKSFKTLHRARMVVFEGDTHGLQFVRSKINEGFRKNAHVKDESVITNLVKFSREVENELRTSVVQARSVEPGIYQVKFTDDTVRMDNFPYQEVPEDVLVANSKHSKEKCQK